MTVVPPLVDVALMEAVLSMDDDAEEQMTTVPDFVPIANNVWDGFRSIHIPTGATGRAAGNKGEEGGILVPAAVTSVSSDCSNGEELEALAGTGGFKGTHQGCNDDQTCVHVFKVYTE